MDIKKITEAVLQSEGYAQGFKDGFASCAKNIIMQIEIEEQQAKTKANEGISNPTPVA